MITIVGPTHPYKGGIAQHTTELAKRLAETGHDTVIETWAAQYPKRLYPGEQRVPHGAESAIYGETRHLLRWYDPIGWIRCGVRSRRASALIVTLVVPVQVVAYVVILFSSRLGGGRPDLVVVAHNVLPHEPRLFDRSLVKLAMRLSDRIIVHTDDQGSLADSLGAKRVERVSLPPHLATSEGRSRVSEPTHRRLLFFGLVRPYKGVDDLLTALVQLPGLELGIHGEIWGGHEPMERALEEMGLADRVDLFDGYVPDGAVPGLFEGVDALVLPYRSGTASQLVLIANGLGIPVVATTAGSFAEQIEDGVNGLLCPPNDPAVLASTIARLYEPGVLGELRSHLPPPDDKASMWQAYLAAILDNPT